MNDDNKNTFSDILKKTKDNNGTTFESIFKKDEKKDDVTLKNLLEQTKEIKIPKESIKKEVSNLTSTNIFETALKSNNDIFFPEKELEIEDLSDNQIILSNIKNEQNKQDVTINEKIQKNNTILFENNKEKQEQQLPKEKLDNDNINIKPLDIFNNSNNNSNQEIKIESQKNDNISFVETNNKEQNNIFFENITESSSKEKTSNNNLNLNEKKENNKEEPKTVSPFFEEISESPNDNLEDNPFFNNSINLIETQDKIHSSQENIDISKTKHFNVKIVKKKEPLIKIVLGVLSYAMFIFLLLIGITLLIYVADIKIRESKGDYTPPKYNAYVVLTGSMLPEIKVYDVVITKKATVSELKEGDIITFASSDSRFAGTIITHRIIKKNYDAENNKYTFQTKGDNNNVADSALVEENNIYGKVILKIPKLGYLQEFLATDGGWIIVVLIPCLAVVSYDIVKITKGLKRKKYKKIKVNKK